MRKPTKFVKPLTEAQRERLQEIHKHDPAHRTRRRAQAILLSARGYSLDALAAIYQQDRDRITLWLDWWDEYEDEGLADNPKSGRPSHFPDAASKKKCSRSSRRSHAL